ncbi:uncharacterized protein [Rutidosis leptorrhynchoides]|uniref:uncharacterized protein isoform X2 n=1 Tax=Rutidosis leptorrhynchoides TaxID=125765 RepID=UPI003A9A0408
MSVNIAYSELVKSSSSSSDEYFTIFLIHGLLGCADDFSEFSDSLASSLSTSHPLHNLRMVVVDLRNHGKSSDIEGLSPPHDIVNAAKDIANLVTSLDWAWPDVVIGHSLGGKVVLQYALSCARGDYGDSAQLPKQVWVLDAIPGSLEHLTAYQEVGKALHTLQMLPSIIPSKEDLDYWGVLEQPPKGTEIAIVRTENRGTWDPDVVERLESLVKREHTGKVSVDVVPRSGHWIHKDEPQKLLEIMTPRIASLVQLKL